MWEGEGEFNQNKKVKEIECMPTKGNNDFWRRKNIEEIVYYNEKKMKIISEMQLCRRLTENASQRKTMFRVQVDMGK